MGAGFKGARYTFTGQDGSIKAAVEVCKLPKKKRPTLIVEQMPQGASCLSKTAFATFDDDDAAALFMAVLDKLVTRSGGQCKDGFNDGQRASKRNDEQRDDGRILSVFAFINGVVSDDDPPGGEYVRTSVAFKCARKWAREHGCGLLPAAMQLAVRDVYGECASFEVEHCGERRLWGRIVQSDGKGGQTKTGTLEVFTTPPTFYLSQPDD